MGKEDGCLYGLRESDHNPRHYTNETLGGPVDPHRCPVLEQFLYLDGQRLSRDPFESKRTTSPMEDCGKEEGSELPQ